jgi:hypothetical protein
MKFDLDTRAEAAEQERSLAAMRAAKAQCRERFATPARVEANPPEPVQATKPEPVGASDLGDPPFLGCPSRWRPGRGGKAHHRPHHGARLPSSNPQRVRAHPHARQQQSTRTRQPPNPPQDQCDLFVAARPNPNHLHTRQPKNPAPPCVHLVVAAA